MAAKKPKAGSRALRARSRLALIGLIAILLIVVGTSIWWLRPAPPDQETELPAPAPTEEPPVTTAEATPGTEEPAEPPADTAEVTPETEEPAEPPATTAEVTPETEEPAEPPADTAEVTPETEEPAEPPAATAEVTPETEEPAEPPAATAEATPDTDQPVEPPATVAGLTPGTGEAPEPPPTAFAPPPDQASAPPETLNCPTNGDAAPGCALAETVLSALETPGAPPKVTLNRPGGIYLDREFLVVETELPAEAGGYLYLDVLTDAGDVYHLLPEPMRQDNELPAGGEIRVGVEQAERRDGVRHWQVGEPFGKGYLLALVSEKPLYDELRPVEESIADYRDVLLKALADQGTGKKAAQITPIEFRPRG